MSEKVLSREELEVTQRMQQHFPFGFVPSGILNKWKGARKEHLETAMFRLVAYYAHRHPIITVPLRFREKLTAQEMLQRGNYKSIPSGILEASLNHMFGYTECTALLLPALREWEGVGVAIQDIRMAGFREATIYELIALGYHYPQLQKEQSIMALGTLVNDSAPILSDFLNQRTIDLMKLSAGCGYRGSFLAIA
jgi:hypothetical protein